MRYPGSGFHLHKSCFFIILSFISVTIFAQSSQYLSIRPEIVEWTDNEHYLIQTYDKDHNPVLQKIDAKTGKGELYIMQKSKKDLLEEALPAGYRVTSADRIAPDMKSLIFVRDNDLYFFRIGSEEIDRLTVNDTPEVNITFSPSGNKIAYTRNRDLFIYDFENKKEIRITNDATENIYNGWASWVYMEEILGRPSAYSAFWWSPDGNRIAWLYTDESEVPLFTLNHLDATDDVHGEPEITHYPKAGDPNPKVKIGIASLQSGEKTWVKTDFKTDQYIAWPFWTPDSKSLAIQVLNRDQNDMKYILADPETGDYELIYRETSKTWVEFSEDIYVLKNGTGFILRSYSSGWENLYFYNWNGNQKARLTDVDWRVNGIVRVDEERGFVYFSGTGTESTDKHLFRVRLDGTDMIQITKEPGTHDVLISPDGSYFLDSWNSIECSGGIIVLDKNAKVIREIYRPDNQIASEKSVKTELMRVQTSDGLFNLPVMITYPGGFTPEKKYPVIFTVYGGPNSASVTNTWRGDSPDWYGRNGIIKVSVDHRGSGHFGIEGQSYLYRNLGKWEIKDYEDVVKWLYSKPFIDPSRIGITGSSYGGYITSLALTAGSDYWTHGIAVSSVTDWRLYDNIYTERYMDMPSDNQQGYFESSVLNYADKLRGKLLITHGDIDDNVHLQNSIQLISKLEDAGKTFEFMLYPGGRHGFTGKKREHSVAEAYKFWTENFFGNQ